MKWVGTAAAYNYGVNAYSRIEIEAAFNQEAVQDGQCVVVESCDTIKEAKARVKYILSDDFRRSSELTNRIGYARIMADGECLYDYFGKS